MPERISPKPHAGGKTNRPASVFLDTRGNPSLGIGICQRCQFKFPLHMLQDDPNIPNFKVCDADRDDFDPYRMPARQADKLTLPYVRPDQSLSNPMPPQPEWLTQFSDGDLTFVSDSGGVLTFTNISGDVLTFTGYAQFNPVEPFPDLDPGSSAGGIQVNVGGAIVWVSNGGTITFTSSSGPLTFTV